MKLFLSPFKPAVYLGGFLLLCIAIPLGRFEFGDGGLWTMLGAAVLAIFFAVGGKNWAAMNQLGTSFNRWMNSAALTALVSSTVVAPLTAASAVFHQSRSPYYWWYDPFLVTNGEPMPWIDGNGDPYLIDGAAQDASSMALTVLLHFAVFFTMAFIGLAIGLAQGTRMIWLMVGAVFAGSFLGGVTAALTEDPLNPFRPNVYVAAIAVAAIFTLAACSVVFTRTRKFVR